MTLVMTLVCFLCGSLMFCYWIGLLLKTNIRSVGDGNPGGANLWSTAGYKFGIVGIALDFLKGYLPILLIINTELWSGYQLIPVALAPIVGHAFSPFLKFNGGKSLSVSFGVWSALTRFRASLCLAIILALLLVTMKIVKKGRKPTSNEDGLGTTIGFLLLSIYLFYERYPSYILWIWFGNLLLFLWKNKSGMTQIFKDKLNRDERYSKMG